MKRKTEPPKNNLGELLSLYIRVNNLTLAEFAKLTGLPKSTVFRVVDGDTILTKNLLLLLNWMFSKNEMRG